MTAQSFEVLIDTSVKNSAGEPIDEFLAGTEWIGRVIDDWVVITLYNGDIGFLPLSATTLATTEDSFPSVDHDTVASDEGGATDNDSVDGHLGDTDLGLRPASIGITEVPGRRLGTTPTGPARWDRPDPDDHTPQGGAIPLGALSTTGMASPPATPIPAPVPSTAPTPETAAHDPAEALDPNADLMGQPLMRFAAIVAMLWAAYTLVRGWQEYWSYDALSQAQESTLHRVSVSPIMLPIPRRLFEHSWLFYNNGSPRWSPFYALTALCLLAAVVVIVKMSMGTVRLLTASLWLHLLLTSYLILGTLIEMREFNPVLPIGAGISAAAWAGAVPFAVTVMARPYIRSVQQRQRKHVVTSYTPTP